MLRPTANPVPPPDTECPLAFCMEYMSGSWTPHILWYLRGGPRRFGDLRRDLSGVSAKVLTEQLRALEDRLMVERRTVHTAPPTTEYSLTPLGQRFNPILEAIVEVGREIKQAKRSAPREPDASTIPDEDVQGDPDRRRRQRHQGAHSHAVSASP